MGCRKTNDVFWEAQHDVVDTKPIRVEAIAGARGKSILGLDLHIQIWNGAIFLYTNLYSMSSGIVYVSSL